MFVRIVRGQTAISDVTVEIRGEMGISAVFEIYTLGVTKKFWGHFGNQNEQKTCRSKAFFVRAQWPVKVFSHTVDDVTVCKNTFLLYVFTINYSLGNLITRESKLIET